MDTFKARGDVISIGPFADRGNLAIFRTRDAAEAFVKQALGVLAARSLVGRHTPKGFMNAPWRLPRR